MYTNNLFTAKEAARTFGCCEATLRRFRQKGILKAGIHYRRKFAGNQNSPVLYKIKECQEVLEDIMVSNLKDLKAPEENKDINSAKSIPKEYWVKENGEFHLHLTLTICSYFWSILDKDFGEEVDKESIHEIMDLTIPELTLKHCINILNNIDPKKLPKIKKRIEQYHQDRL